MSIVKKNAEKKSPEKKPRAPRKVKVAKSIDELDDAVVDGKLLVPIRGKVLFERKSGSKTEIHIGYVHTVSDGAVHIWDETINQYYVFSLLEAGRVKVKVA